MIYKINKEVLLEEASRPLSPAEKAILAVAGTSVAATGLAAYGKYQNANRPVEMGYNNHIGQPLNFKQSMAYNDAQSHIESLPPEEQTPIINSLKQGLDNMGVPRALYSDSDKASQVLNMYHNNPISDMFVK